MNDEGLEVGSTLGEQLASMDSCTSNNGRVIAGSATENCVVRGLTTRTKEVVGDTTDVRLYEQSAKKTKCERATYGGKRKDAAELVADLQVQDVPHSVVLVEVGRT